MVKLYELDQRVDELPNAFTALNGAVQRVQISFKPEFNLLEKSATLNVQNALVVLNALRSNGAQPILTMLTPDMLVCNIEQAWCYGKRGDMQVSANDRLKKDEFGNRENLQAQAVEDIKQILDDAKLLQYVAVQGDHSMNPGQPEIFVFPISGSLV